MLALEGVQLREQNKVTTINLPSGNIHRYGVRLGDADSGELLTSTNSFDDAVKYMREYKTPQIAYKNMRIDCTVI